ncbi:hypothetical protein AM571_CH02436 [Rhizobium etli 8C-3]|uniref:Uncharacterized protein n=1 Tax=Rhizobium etli 8C-3 TaxID=538025 RepID=A0A1L5P528_RHIET|nr:hypothetical protein AM571_CH02436 [Rhizobium etli 8C-3]
MSARCLRARSRRRRCSVSSSLSPQCAIRCDLPREFRDMPPTLLWHTWRLLRYGSLEQLGYLLLDGGFARGCPGIGAMSLKNQSRLAAQFTARASGA